jgi:manganese transport protein
VTIVLWVLCEDRDCRLRPAEVIGAAIALNLLFGLPLIWGSCLTACDVLIVLSLQHRGFRCVEELVVRLILLIAGRSPSSCGFAQPNSAESLGGFVPQREILAQPDMLYIAIGILARR